MTPVTFLLGMNLTLRDVVRQLWYGLGHIPETAVRVVSGLPLTSNDVPSVAIVLGTLLVGAGIVVVKVHRAAR